MCKERKRKEKTRVATKRENRNKLSFGVHSSLAVHNNMRTTRIVCLQGTFAIYLVVEGHDEWVQRYRFSIPNKKKNTWTRSLFIPYRVVFLHETSSTNHLLRGQFRVDLLCTRLIHHPKKKDLKQNQTKPKSSVKRSTWLHMDYLWTGKIQDFPRFSIAAY